ncbi:MAG: exopolysaccharide transport family protein [Beijerinckiaceae bacterium]|nr:exopolysaccharide transport family protein [Beijerinckiaceae bacterium]
MFEFLKRGRKIKPVGAPTKAPVAEPVVKAELAAKTVPGAAPRPGDDVDLKELLRAIGRKKSLILGVTLVAFLGSLAFVNLVAPKYTAEARLLLENRDTYYSRPEKDGRGNAEAIDPEAVQSQVQVLGSRDLARLVIKNLNLGALPEFDPVLKGIPAYMRVLILLGFVRDPTLSTPEERVLESFTNKVSIFSVGKSRVIGIEASTLNPDIAAKIANNLAQEYLAQQQEAKKQTTQVASSWLNQTIEPLRQKVVEAEARVEAYRSKNNLFVGANNTTIISQQLSELNTQLSTARAMQAEQQAKAQLIKDALRTGRIFEVSDIIKDDLIRRLTENRSTLRALYASEQKVYLPQHPRIKELAAQIADLEGQIRGAAQRVTRSLENDARSAASRVAALQADIESQKKVNALASDDDVTLKALEREAKALREQLETYSAKAIDANARDTQTGSPADARIVAVALAPSTPSFPKSAPIVFLTTLAGLVLSTFFVAAGELLKAPPRMAPVAMRVEPVMPVTPEAAPAAPAPIATEPPPDEARFAGSSLAEQHGTPPVAVPRPPRMDAPMQSPFDRSVAALAQRCRSCVSTKAASGKAGGVLVTVSGAAEGHGATSVAIALSRGLAAQSRTILIDLNQDSPGLDHLVAHSDATGLSDLLCGEASFGEAIHRDRESRLNIMPLGLIDEDVVASDLLGNVFDALKQSYEFLVIDAGIAGSQPDEMIARSDLAVLVAIGDREADATKAAYHQLSLAGAANIAVMFNEAQRPAPIEANAREPEFAV